MRISDWSSDVCSSDLSGFLRYQASSTLGYGGSLNLRDAVDTSHSAQLFLDKQTAWGQTRVQVDQASSQGRSDSWQVGIDQAFPLQHGTRLSASLSYGCLRYDDNIAGNGRDAPRTPPLALSGGRDLTQRLPNTGKARRTQGTRGDALRGT